MKAVEKESRHYLLTVRLNNYSALCAAYGDELASNALKHVRRSLERHLGKVLIAAVESEELTVLAENRLLESYSPDELIELLCSIISAEPFRCADVDVLLDICAAYRPVDSSTSSADFERLLAEAAAELEFAHPRSISTWRPMSAKEEARYRADMARSVQLLKAIRRRTAFFVWRPIADPKDRGRILYYDGRLRYANESGQQVECDTAITAFERLGLTHIVDLQLVSDVLDELQADPLARLSVPISAKSLSANISGREAGWNEIFTRLRRDPALGPRLILEVADTSDLRSHDDLEPFLDRLRALGVRLAVGRFGGLASSVEQLIDVAPDIIKIDSGFLHTAHQSDRSRARVGPLLDLARTVARMVVLDGVASSWHLLVALDEEAEWVAGSYVGGTSIGRDWINVNYGDAVAGMSSFNHAFGDHGSAPPKGQHTTH
ncbi:EAL domain-containing protein [Sphingobium fuliginis]|uniref:GGDEF family protein n=1 Tax=Sphingobium fuliginis (strain ATCC 27551) TaxID=336203 RepID=A0A292Z9S2_SPHSA|nr:EAL domain-containing protein [Sphingobium fuliginis]GAY19560.1 GGDEF family protein [Sphingobium fuliginis]